MTLPPCLPAGSTLSLQPLNNWCSSGLHPSTCLCPLLTSSSTSVALSTTCVLTTLTFISSAWTSPLKYSGIANIYLTSLFGCLISISHLTSLKVNLSSLQTYCSLGLSWLRKWYIHPCSCYLGQKPIESVSDIQSISKSCQLYLKTLFSRIWPFLIPPLQVEATIMFLLDYCICLSIAVLYFCGCPSVVYLIIVVRMILLKYKSPLCSQPPVAFHCIQSKNQSTRIVSGF